MTINLNSSAEKIVEQLSPLEIKILYQCGKLGISIHKNVNENTIKKKLKNEDLKNFSKAWKNLRKSGLIVKYRNENYGIPKKGREVIHYIVKTKHKQKYEALKRIYMIS